MKVNYLYARPLGSNGPYERIIDDDYPTNPDGSKSESIDMFKLEKSGWTRYIEFMPE